jgi:hypothetical protein
LETTIHYWTPPSSGKFRFQLRNTLKSAQVQLVQSHEDYGIVRIAAREPDLADFFGYRVEILETSSQDAQMVSKLVTNLRCDQSDGGLKVQVFSITVFGDESGNLVQKDCRLLWKWIKPQSPYRKSGFWDHKLTQVLMDAEWTAGKDVVLLAKGVGEEEYDRVVKGEKKS